MNTVDGGGFGTGGDVTSLAKVPRGKWSTDGLEVK